VRERVAKVQPLYSLDAVVVQVQHPNAGALLQVADFGVPFLVEREVSELRQRLLERYLGAVRLKRTQQYLSVTQRARSATQDPETCLPRSRQLAWAL
jgi:hypothetical protein